MVSLYCILWIIDPVYIKTAMKNKLFGTFFLKTNEGGGGFLDIQFGMALLSREWRG